VGGAGEKNRRDAEQGEDQRRCKGAIEYPGREGLALAGLGPPVNPAACRPEQRRGHHEKSDM